MTNGGLNHVMWHCSGLADFTNGLGQAAGLCAGNDPVGDRVVLTGSQRNPDQKVVRGTIQLDRGAGKYAGIRGHKTYVDYSGEF